MAEILNLRRVRKAKAKDAKDAEANNNRKQHGVPKPARDLADARNAKQARSLDDHKLNGDE